MKTDVKFVGQLRGIGLKSGDIVMVHSSYKSMGIENPEIAIASLLEVLGNSGTLMMPGLSYKQIPPNIHKTDETPVCVGYLPEYFRKRNGTVRSVHPTHSVCAIGMQANDLLSPHIDDTTPCGKNSPFNGLFHAGGKILMIGCGLRPNTAMHAIEEYVVPPYLFASPVIYTITDGSGTTFEKEYIPHNFRGYVQRYERMKELLTGMEVTEGRIGNAESYLIDAKALFETALFYYKKNPLYFVDEGEEE